MLFANTIPTTPLSLAVYALAGLVRPHTERDEDAIAAAGDVVATYARDLDLAHTTDVIDEPLTARVVRDWMQASISVGATVVHAAWDVHAPGSSGPAHAFLGGVGPDALAEAVAIAAAVAKATREHASFASDMMYFRKRQRPSAAALHAFRYDHVRKISEAVKAALEAADVSTTYAVPDVDFDSVAPKPEAVEARVSE